MFTFAAPNRAQAVPFFLLSANAQGDNWYYSPYFGRYNISYYPYIYKDCFGWLYWYGEVGDNGGVGSTTTIPAIISGRAPEPTVMT